MRILTMLFCLLALLGCEPEKIAEQRGEELIFQAITSGQWKVTNYVKGGTDVTADFAAYKFQFKTNYTVDALNNNAVESTGTWSADGTAKTITSQFNGASYPVPLLNGTFQILNTTWTSVNASQTVNGELRTLRLEKL